MKKIFTLCSLAIVALGFNLNAQSTRLVLAEEFTQASCPPCATQNPTFNTLLNGNANKVVAIKYQTSWPGVDPMNAQNPTTVATRVSYYGVSGVPAACMDGKQQTGSSYVGAPANWTLAKINTRQATTSNYTLGVTHTFNSTMDSIHITLDIAATVADSGDLVAHVALIERDVPFCTAPGSNGELVFEGVMRVMLPSAAGTPLASTWTVGQMQTITFDAKIPSYIYDKNELAVVAFIQDNAVAATTTISGALSGTTITVGSAAGLEVGMYLTGTGVGHGAIITAISGTTLTMSDNNSATIAVAGNGTFTKKDVRQAAYSAPQPIVNDAALACSPISGIPLISCGTALNPVVTFENMGTANITSLNLNYTVDGVAGTPIPWTGTLAPNATATINIPSISSTVGSHTLHVNVSDPNTSIDYNLLKDSASAVFSVAGLGTNIGTAAPVVENFAVSTFPPAGWMLYNADGSFTWTRNATAGFNGAGCAKINFWSSPATEVDELILKNYDFSLAGTTSAQIDFDVAYCQESTQSDRIEVLYSIDCGQNWLSAFNEAGTTLASGNPASTTAWTPTSASSWHHKTGLLPSAAGNNNVFIKFKATSAYGNNAYVDNINLSTNLIASVPTLNSAQDIIVYPNPSQGQVNIKLELANSSDVSVVISNELGAVVKEMVLSNVMNGIYPVDLSNEAKGNYQVSIKTDKQVIVKRITITE